MNMPNISVEKTCTIPSCFLCIMKHPKSSLRREGITKCFKEMHLINDEERVQVLAGLWNLAMAQPNEPEFPSLGIFKCMANLINKGINNIDWLLKGQNIYIPYYAAHVIGSYTMNKVEFAEKAVESGVIPPLMELLRGNLSWVEQRVAIRALGHLASYKSTFSHIADYEEEIVELAMHLACTCLDSVHKSLVHSNIDNTKLRYHIDLLTQGIQGKKRKNKKAEEWGHQIQCWSIHLLNCFAIKRRSLDLICKGEFLKKLSGMWGGLANHKSPCGIGLVRILCYSSKGRRNIAEVKETIIGLCNLSRSSDEWQYIGIDCLLLLLEDSSTRHMVIPIATFYLVDLVELKYIKGRPNVGERIACALLADFNERKLKIKNDEVRSVLKQLWILKVERRRREKEMSEKEVKEKRIKISLMKQEGNHRFWAGEIESAVMKYSEALYMCPLRLRKERVVLYSNRAQCYLLLKNPNPAISDTTRALCLSNPINSHSKSLWRRSQAYDMKGMAKESLMDCLSFVYGCTNSNMSISSLKIPYYAVHMIKKQMDATRVFVAVESNSSGYHADDERRNEKENKGFITGLPTILEEPEKCETSRGKLETARRIKKVVLMSNAELESDRRNFCVSQNQKKYCQCYVTT